MNEYFLPGSFVLAGLVLLIGGGDHLVKHAVHLAASYRVPKIVVGAVILGFGTSLPELFVSVTAVFRENQGIAIGNVVGSNIANSGLILGLGAVWGGFHISSRALRADLPLALLGALFLWIYVSQTGDVSRVAGVVLLAGFAGYLWGSLRYSRANRPDHDPNVVKRHPVVDLLWIVGGLVAIALGARLLVEGAEDIARLLQVSELTIGLTVVAVGTSLPELATLIAAARRGETDLAVGNVAGSNVFNLGLVLGLAAVARPIRTEDVLVARDLPALAVFSALTFPILSRNNRVGRFHGALLLAAYVGYWIWRTT